MFALSMAIKLNEDDGSSSGSGEVGGLKMREVEMLQALNPIVGGNGGSILGGYG